MDAEQKPSCKWRFVPGEFSGDGVWATECGLEFDRLKYGEQPRKHLCMEFCCFCGGTIIDETVDC